MNLRLEIACYKLEIFTFGNFFFPSFLPYCWKANRLKGLTKFNSARQLEGKVNFFIHKIKFPHTFIKQKGTKKKVLLLYFNNLTYFFFFFSSSFFQPCWIPATGQRHKKPTNLPIYSPNEASIFRCGLSGDPGTTISSL